VVAGEGIEPSTVGYGPTEIPFLYPAETLLYRRFHSCQRRG